MSGNSSKSLGEFRCTVDTEDPPPPGHRPEDRLSRRPSCRGPLTSCGSGSRSSGSTPACGPPRAPGGRWVGATPRSECGQRLNPWGFVETRPTPPQFQREPGGGGGRGIGTTLPPFAFSGWILRPNPSGKPLATSAGGPGPVEGHTVTASLDLVTLLAHAMETKASRAQGIPTPTPRTAGSPRVDLHPTWGVQGRGEGPLTTGDQPHGTGRLQVGKSPPRPTRGVPWRRPRPLPAPVAVTPAPGRPCRIPPPPPNGWRLLRTPNRPFPHHHNPSVLNSIPVLACGASSPGFFPVRKRTSVEGHGLSTLVPPMATRPQ